MELTMPQLTLTRQRSEVLSPRSHSNGVMDLQAFLLSDTGRPNKFILPPRTTRPVPTGLVVSPPPDHTLLILSYSALARRSVFVANAPGILDPSDVSVIEVLLYNGGHETQWINHEDYIAQLIAIPNTKLSLAV